MHSNWRDCQAWKDYGAPLSTTSNDASKMFDATMTQYVAWYDDQSVGGVEKSMEKMLAADENFVMGHVLKNGLELLGTSTSVRINDQLTTDIKTMTTMAEEQTTLSPREMQHVKAVNLWADGKMIEACDVWEAILLDNPLDMLATRFAHDSYFYLGLSVPMRDSLARILPEWKESFPLYGYLLGMYSFGLEECNLYPEAEKTARKGLEINPRDGWCTHTMAHVMEMMGRQDEGIAFMSETERDWTTCNMLSCHNYWHWALHLIEKGDYSGAIGVYDQHVATSVKGSGAALDIVDACSLLFRLEMEGMNVGDKWNDLYEIVREHVDDHVITFNDNHILLACLGSKKMDVVNQMMESIKDYIKSAEGDNRDITKEVGLPICEAFVAYNDGDYARAVDIMCPVRYKIIKIGGSHAQRDLYNLFLIQAALKSSKPTHHKLARALLAERKNKKPCSPMTDRLMQKALALHAD